MQSSDSTATPGNSTGFSRPTVLAVALGALLTPVAMGLSLALLPLGAPLLIYGLLAAGFAFYSPDRGWGWGLWVAGGFFLALILVLIAVPFFSDTGIQWGAEGGFTTTTLLFGLFPAVVGGCLGGAAGSMLATGRYKLAGVPLAILVLLSATAPFVG